MAADVSANVAISQVNVYSGQANLPSGMLNDLGTYMDYNTQPSFKVRSSATTRAHRQAGRQHLESHTSRAMATVSSSVHGCIGAAS